MNKFPKPKAPNNDLPLRIQKEDSTITWWIDGSVTQKTKNSIFNWEKERLSSTYVETGIIIPYHITTNGSFCFEDDCVCNTHVPEVIVCTSLCCCFSWLF